MCDSCYFVSALQRRRTNTGGLGGFQGTWKEDLAKSRVRPTMTYTFTQQPDGSLLGVRGSGAGALRMQVRFDGKDYPGEGSSERTVSWKKVDDHTFEQMLKRDGKETGRARWIISPDGKTARQETRTVTGQQARDASVTVFERTSGTGPGLIGSWKPVSFQSSAPTTRMFTITPDGRFTHLNPDAKDTFTVLVDGKEYPYTGPMIRPDVTVSSHAADNHTIRAADFRNGNDSVQ